MKEYVIFGKAPGGEFEDLLISEQVGLKSMEQAERVCLTLESEHGCTETRVFCFDGSAPNFIEALKG